MHTAAQSDFQEKAALYAQADEIDSHWKEGGTYRIAAHAAVGDLTGGGGGAIGAAASSMAIPVIGAQIAELDIPVAVKQALVMATGASIGAAADSGSGAASAFNETSNNYLTAANLRSRDQRIKMCQANGDTACEVRVQQEYDLKNALNTGELKRSSLVERQYLGQNRTELEQLLLDPKVSEETRQQARRSIKELDTAINVIDKAPVLRDAAELGLLAADVATLGELAAARVLTSSVVKELAFSRTGRVLSDEAAAKVANNFYTDADGFAYTTVREFQPGTTVRAENVNAGQVIDRDGLPRVDDAKRLNDQQVAQMLGRSASYWGTSYPAWKEGTMVADRVITQPETYKMVISADQKEAIDTAIRNGDMNSAVRRLGGWATKDPIGSINDVRDNLAITDAFKKTSDGSILYSIEFKVKPGVGIREGTVGPMWDPYLNRPLPGGGNQVNFLINRPLTNPQYFEISPSSVKELK